MNRSNKKETIILFGAFLAFIHFVIAVVLVLVGGEATMTFLALDFPLAVLCDYVPLVSDVEDGMSQLIPSGNLFWVVFGTFMYFGFGLLIGWCIWRMGSRKRTTSPMCPTCDYSLTGNVSGICSECGMPIPKEMKVVEANQSV